MSVIPSQDEFVQYADQSNYFSGFNSAHGNPIYLSGYAGITCRNSGQDGCPTRWTLECRATFVLVDQREKLDKRSWENGEENL
jgi:hypothetical protein